MEEALGLTEGNWKPPVEATYCCGRLVPGLACTHSYFRALFFLFNLILQVPVFGLHVCMCVTCMPGTFLDQKTASDTLELELKAVLSLYVLAENRT